jgi:hypothetical protein
LNGNLSSDLRGFGSRFENWPFKTSDIQALEILALDILASYIQLSDILASGIQFAFYLQQNNANHSKPLLDSS